MSHGGPNSRPARATRVIEATLDEVKLTETSKPADPAAMVPSEALARTQRAAQILAHGAIRAAREQAASTGNSVTGTDRKASETNPCSK